MQTLALFNFSWSWLVDVLDKAGLIPHFNTALGIFCAIAWLGTLLAAGLFVLSLFSGDGGEFSGEGVETGDFSIRALIGFMLGFGWGGYLSLSAGSTVLTACLVGFGAGLIMFIAVAAIMRMMRALHTDGTLDVKQLVGCQGTVYVTLPPAGEPGGQVQIMHPSQMTTMAAIQMGDVPLPAQTRIIVVEATSSYLLVKKA